MKNSYTINLFNLDGFEEFSKEFSFYASSTMTSFFFFFFWEQCQKRVF